MVSQHTHSDGSVHLQPRLAAFSPKLAHDGVSLPPHSSSLVNSVSGHHPVPLPTLVLASSATLTSLPQTRSPSPQAGLLVPQAGTYTAQAGSCPSLDSLTPTGIIDMLSDLASSFLLGLLTGLPPLPRPNTLCEQPIFDVSDVPVTVGTLQLCHWSQFLDLYPDHAFTTQLQGALQHGVKLGYDSPLHTSTRLDVTNLPMDTDDIQHLHHEIEVHLAEGYLCCVNNPASVQLVCSPVGMVPKPHSDKRCTIYNLSHPHQPGSCLLSINNSISTSFITIHYKSLDAVMDFIHNNLSTSLWKADLEDAFRHIMVVESDA